MRKITQAFKIVFCTFIEDEATAHEQGGLWFCGKCGATDHQEI